MWQSRQARRDCAGSAKAKRIDLSVGLPGGLSMACGSLERSRAPDQQQCTAPRHPIQHFADARPIALDRACAGQLRSPCPVESIDRLRRLPAATSRFPLDGGLEIGRPALCEFRGRQLAEARRGNSERNRQRGGHHGRGGDPAPGARLRCAARRGVEGGPIHTRPKCLGARTGARRSDNSSSSQSDMRFPQIRQRTLQRLVRAIEA